MAGQQTDVLLCILLHASSLWNHIADILVILLQTSLLVGNIWITIEDLGTRSTGFTVLYCPWVLEFRTVVCKDNGEILLESTDSKCFTDAVYRRDYALLCTVRKKNENHKTAASEEKSKQALAGGTAAFYRVHLYNIQIRKCRGIGLKINIGSLVAVSLRDVPGSRFGPFLALFVTDTAREVDVPCSKDSPVQIVIKRSLAYRDTSERYYFLKCRL